MGNFLNKKIIAVFITAVFIIFFHYLGALSLVERYLSTAFNPAGSFFFRQGAKIQKFYVSRGDNMFLVELNEKLEENNRRLLEENTALYLLRDENEALREQLKFYQKYNYEKKLANVISRTVDSGTRQVLTVDAGYEDNIRVGQPIIASEGAVVGKITEVKEKISHACVITDKNCHLAAAVLGRGRSSGLTQGDLGLTVNMDFIPQNEIVNIKDIVITSGIEPEMPRGLIIGEVQEVVNEPNDLFKTAVINPAADLDSVNIVSVIIN